MVVWENQVILQMIIVCGVFEKEVLIQGYKYIFP